MPIQPEPVLRAAVRWLEGLPASGAARCRALFTTHSDFSDITPTQYETAYGWLNDAGLLGNKDAHGSPELQVYEAALLSGNTPWFPDSDVLIREPEELPEDALRAAEGLGLSRTQAYEHLVAMWGKVDAEARARIGTAGELALVRLLTASLRGGQVEHVAARSDGYGYDIAVDADGNSLHIEAKSTTRRSRLTVFLSRHEYETMRRDPAWELVAVRLTRDLQVAAVGSVPKEWIAAHAPRDGGANGRWESCRLDIPPSVPKPGIQRLLLALTGASALLDGTTGWTTGR
ncbi:DUF3883 domain-containing protein [Phytomonospora sp. NPDC050363]|uniref:DUF3883 domain-containing protein n=1 Tax=Phytomonospora sp. NPDC050363 TaxID=3155642 RepID=UPI0033EF5FEA